MSTHDVLKITVSRLVYSSAGAGCSTSSFCCFHRNKKSAGQASKCVPATGGVVLSSTTTLATNGAASTVLGFFAGATPAGFAFDFRLTTSGSWTLSGFLDPIVGAAFVFSCFFPQAAPSLVALALADRAGTA